MGSFFVSHFWPIWGVIFANIKVEFQSCFGLVWALFLALKPNFKYMSIVGAEKVFSALFLISFSII